MQFAIDKVGQWSDEQDFKVEADRIKQYAAATNDPIPAHPNGELAPPVFSVVPVWDAMGGAVGEVTPPDAFPFVVHGVLCLLAVVPSFVLVNVHATVWPGIGVTVTPLAVGVQPAPEVTRA